MSYALGVLAFAVALLVSVMLHEFGHFATAKHYGMKATRFFVGFGPTLWSTRRGETEYGVKAIPAGGFVKIVGMTPLEEVDPGDENRAFYRQPARQRVVVLAAGSIIHFLIAIFVLYGVIATTGDPLKPHTTLTVDSTIGCIITDPHRSACTPSDPRAPALGKLHSGDQIEAIDGHAVSSYGQLRSRLEASPGRQVTLTVRRDGRDVQVPLTPVGIRDKGQQVGKVGFYPKVVPAPVGVAAAVPRTFTTIGTFFTSTISALGDLPHEVSLILENKPRDNGAASVVGIGRVSGQIAQAQASVGERIANLMLIVAQVNFFVGVFNLLPLLPLDGGHIAIVGYEEGRRRVYRWFRRPDPGRVDLMKIMPVTYAVVAAFVGLSLLLIYADIVNPIKIQ
ncbi:MAG TPA: site-2 protease family protein [Mycobacteriales bacterium]|nr:site-2 protease family protein [Mycobacteriales bacterium]